MTYKQIFSALKSAIKAQTDFPVMIIPQKAETTTAHIELLFQDCRDNGENGEKLIISATYRTSGTHSEWLTKTIALKRKLNAFENNFMDFECGEEKLRAYWRSFSDPQWVYPDEDENSMPAEYVMKYEIELDIPSRLITEEDRK